VRRFVGAAQTKFPLPRRYLPDIQLLLSERSHTVLQVAEALPAQLVVTVPFDLAAKDESRSAILTFLANFLVPTKRYVFHMRAL